MIDPTELRLLWIPLGAGMRVPVVRASGWLYERLDAAVHRRAPAAIYHAALLVSIGGGPPAAIEVAPVWQRTTGPPAAIRGPVGLRRLGRWRLFQYQVRCSPGGVIPDASYAVGGGIAIASDARRAATLLAAVQHVPTPTWGRDELGAGEMWNSNSVIAWLLRRSGHPTEGIGPPPGGRAPGWSAGLIAARRADGASGAAQYVRGPPRHRHLWDA